MVDYVFTRPVRRPAYLAGKYLSHLVCTQLDFLLPFAVLLAVGLSRHIPGLGAAAPLLLLGQAVTIAAFSAFGFLCGILTSRYVVIGLVYAATVEAGLGNIPTALNRVSLTHHVRAMLAPLAGHAGADAEGPLAATLQLLLWSAAMLTLAAVVFSRRELAGPTRDA
jgi:ABC-type transport system involved in multi-copper enzyme maturation permease subunit